MQERDIRDDVQPGGGGDRAARAAAAARAGGARAGAPARRGAARAAREGYNYLTHCMRADKRNGIYWKLKLFFFFFESVVSSLHFIAYYKL